MFVRGQRHRGQSQSANGETHDMHQLGAGVLGGPQQHKGKPETHGVVGGKTEARPGAGSLHFRRAGRGVKNIFGDGGRKIDPHGKHPDPGEKLDQAEFPHPARKVKHERKDVAQAQRPVKFAREDGGVARLPWADIPTC